MLIIPRYILKQFILILIFSLVAICVIFMIVNLLESLDKFLDQHATFGTIVKYYIDFFPEIISMLMPVAMLLATLFSIGRLSGANEITAMKSGGMSLNRIMLPLLMFSLIMSFAQLYFNGWIVPPANQKKTEIEQKYLHDSKNGNAINNLFFRDSPNRNLIIQYYDASVKSGFNAAIEEYSSDTSPRLTRRIEARQIAWDSAAGEWKLINVIDRKFSGEHVATAKLDEEMYKLNIDHDDIIQLKRSPDEMNFTELSNYISLLEQGGKDVRRQLIEYYGNYAFPFANFIVVLFGVPFASVRRKGGIAVQIAAAMIVSTIYLIFTKISQTIGYSTSINPIVVAWSANVFFLFIALIIIRRTRT